MTQARHWPALDGLRGLAILLVIPHNIDAFQSTLPHEWLPAMVSHIGWIGVQIFFVLSGFLITGQLLQTLGSRNYFTSFFVRRGLRILPIYYLSLVIALVVVPALFTLPADVLATHDQQVWLWLFLNNWTQPFFGEVRGFPHYWSLAVEEQFYLVWPVVVLLTGGGRKLLMVCAAAAGLALVARALAMSADLPSNATYMWTICRMDALTTGAAAAVLAREHGSLLQDRRLTDTLWWSALACLAASAVITHTFDLHSPVTVLVGYPLLALVTAAVILVCLDRRGSFVPDLARGVLSLPLLRSVGRYSYAMYIAHKPLQGVIGVPLRGLLQKVGLGGPFWYVGIFVILTYLVGIASYLLVERHFLRLKTHFQPVRDDVHAPKA
ncbi:MAG: acyltransferase [Steroidobacteraceae bacterium]